MSRMMTMFVLHETTKAEVVVFAVDAAHQVAFISLCTKGLAQPIALLWEEVIHTKTAPIANRLLEVQEIHLRVTGARWHSHSRHLRHLLGGRLLLGRHSS